MAIAIREIRSDSGSRSHPCTGPHTVVLEPEDLKPGARIDCVLCGEFVATIEQADLKEKQ